MKPNHNSSSKSADNQLSNFSGAQLPDSNLTALWNRLVGDFRRLALALSYKLFGSAQFSWQSGIKIMFLASLTYYLFVGDLFLGSQPVSQPGQPQTEFYGFGGSQTKTAPTVATAFNATPNDSKKERLVKKYIRRFMKVAQEEQSKFGIPASISMAQGILESNAGDSRLATKTNNHFGLKCFSKSCPKGHCTNFNDDHHKDFFLKFGTAWESWRAHSNLLNGKRYNGLKVHGTDYKAWAKGLKANGYATAKDYDDRLIELIENYNLQLLDH